MKGKDFKEELNKLLRKAHWLPARATSVIPDKKKIASRRACRNFKKEY